MTARDLINSSLRLGGVLETGAAPSANEINDALTVLNQMLSSWSNDNLTINQKIREEFSLTGGVASYTWGPSGAFNSARPIEVIEANLKMVSSNIETPLKLFTTKEYAEISLKSQQSTLFAVYFDGANPLQNVTFWPVPSGAESVVFYSLKPFTTLELNSELSFPPGYERAIRYNLWIDLAPEYGFEVSPGVERIAVKSLGAIKRKNYQVNPLKTDLPTGPCNGSSPDRFIIG